MYKVEQRKIFKICSAIFHHYEWNYSRYFLQDFFILIELDRVSF